MRILFEIIHPAHVHLFKNTMRVLEERGHQVIIAGREREMITQLLDAYGFDYFCLSKAASGMRGLFVEMLKRDFAMWRLARKFDIDLFVGSVVCVTHVAKLTGKKSIMFNDDGLITKTARFSGFPFADTICTPACLPDDFGKKHVRYQGYHELAYLHPNRFTPDPTILQDIGLAEGEKYIVMRFVGLKAFHDVGQRGLSPDMRRRMVREFSRHGQVFITSETPLLPEFEPYRLPVPPHRIHDLLYYATLVVADSQTMTSEAAVLGTPAVRCNSWVGKISYLEELEQKYELTYGFTDEEQAFARSLELLNDPGLKETWQARRAKMLADKIDVTEFMVEMVETYPALAQQYGGKVFPRVGA